MKIVWLLSICLVIQLSAAQDPCPDPYPQPELKLYKGYKLIQATIRKEKKKKLLKKIANTYNADIWKEPRGRKDTADLFVSPDNVTRVMVALREKNIPVALSTYNITQKILDERARIKRRTFRELLFVPPWVRFSLNDFNTYTEIMNQLSSWVESCPNGMRCSLKKIGETHEGRAIKMISLGANPPAPDKRALYIDCLTHAREWISGSTCLYIINKLITGWQTNKQVTNLLKTYDFILVPVVNPDGYVYSWNEDRLWRKNRQPNENSVCVGTDINRNYDSKWCSIPTFPSGSTSPCSDVFCGPFAGSTQEAKAIMDQMKSSELWIFLNGLIKQLKFAKERLILSVSIHSYGKMWLFPYGHKKNGACAKSDFHDDLVAAGNAARVASQNAEGGSGWISDTICDGIYAAPGTTCDFVHKAGVKHSYTPELRGTDFIISNDQIDEAGNEAWQGIVAILSNI